MLENDNNKLK